MNTIDKHILQTYCNFRPFLCFDQIIRLMEKAVSITCFNITSQIAKMYLWNNGITIADTVSDERGRFK